jgi:hypothetical protein
MRKAGQRTGNSALGSKAEAPPPLSSQADSHAWRPGFPTALGRPNRNHDPHRNGKGAGAALSAEATLTRLESHLWAAAADKMRGHMDASEAIQQIAQAIERQRIELGKTSGFERLYARVTKLYFGGILRHLMDLRPILRPGAQLACVVGDQASYLRVMIRTGQLLADLATSVGYEVVGIDLFRARLASATKEQLREEVVILRWPGPSKLNGWPRHATGNHMALKNEPVESSMKTKPPSKTSRKSQMRTSTRIGADLIPRPEIMKKPSAQDSAVIHQHIGPRNADSFRTDLHPDLKADFFPFRKDLTNPPFNMSNWGGENLRQDVRDFSLSASNGERFPRKSSRIAPLNRSSARESALTFLAGQIMSKLTFAATRFMERARVRCRIRPSPVNNANCACCSLRNSAFGLRPSRRLSPVSVAEFVTAKTTSNPHPCSRKITEDARKYAAEQGIVEEEALKKGMEAKSKEFVENGAEVDAKV